MPKTLLLADDSVTIQKVVGISFASEDVTLITVDNGDDALVKAREARPDVILADVVMPGLNGYEVCEAIKADPSLRHIPVLLLTGTFESFDEERASQCGAVGHIAKPFEAQTLVDRVKELLATAPPPAPAVTASPSPGAAGSNSESFDFFDEDQSQADSAATAPPAPEENAAPTADTLAIDIKPAADSGGAFAFGDEDLSIGAGDNATTLEPMDAPVASVAPDSSAALPPDASGDGVAGPGMTRLLDDELGMPAVDTTPEEDSLIAGGMPAGDVGGGEDLFEFDLGTAGDTNPETPAINVNDLAEATVMDPKGASGFDVSSSDLGDPLNLTPAVPAPEPPVISDPVRDDFEVVAPAAPQPVAFVAEPEPAPLAAEPVDQLLGDTPDPGDPLAAVQPNEPELEDLVPTFSGADSSAVQAFVEPTPAAAVSSAPDVDLSRVSPELRNQIHDTLEKIAWEAFGDVTEQIVRQALERVEKIAWEVIPQLAETLIREEIRRMKGESD